MMHALLPQLCHFLLFFRSKNFNVDIPAIAALRRGKYMLSETDTFQKTAKTAFDKGNISQFISKSQLSVVS